MKTAVLIQFDDLNEEEARKLMERVQAGLKTKGNPTFEIIETYVNRWPQHGQLVIYQP